MDRFLELHDSYELYEFTRQYYLDINSISLKSLKFPIAVYFDPETGKPTFKSATQKPKTFKIKFENRGDIYYYETDDIEEILSFVKEKAKRRPKPGDTIVVKDKDCIDTQNSDFFKDNLIDYEYACKFDYGNYPDLSVYYKVIVSCGDFLLIQKKPNEKCYIAREEGVKIVE